MKISAMAPVSIGNFIAGFDLLGAALESLDGEDFGDIVTLETADRLSLTVAGDYAAHLPADPGDNIVSACVDAYARALTAIGGQFRRDFSLHLEKRLPVGSGLGSSASSIVAALAALDAWHDSALPRDVLLRLCGEMEGRVSGGVHYDNVAPSLLGGAQLLLGEGRCTSLPLPDSWRFVVHYPGISVSTRAAREILPKAYPLPALVEFGGHLAALVSGAYRGDESVMLEALQDRLIAPHRAALIPGYAAAENAAREAGALAFGISGSGPTVFAICREASMPVIAAAIAAAFPENPRAFSRLCRLDRRGVRIG